MRVIFYNPQGEQIEFLTSEDKRQAVKNYCLLILGFKEEAATAVSRGTIITLQ